MAQDAAPLEHVADRIVDAERVVALTGAGMSTASGIPDYRGPQGVWTKDPAAERLSTLQDYVADADVRRESWQRRIASGVLDARPNAGHLALAELEHLGRLDTVITQNVDGLHLEAGHEPGRVVEVHGTARDVVCLSCGDLQPMAPVLARLEAGDDDPHCRHCGGILKSATISFGQALDPAVLQRAAEAAAGCDLFLALGSSLVVYPVALLPRSALEAGAELVVVNAGETPYDEEADVVLGDDLTVVLPRLVELVRDRLSG